MKFLVAGERDGRSCLLTQTEWDHYPEDRLSSISVADLQVGLPEVRPVGRSDYRDYGVPVGTARWNRVRFPPNEVRPMHFTNTIDAITVIEGELWLILDDGEHLLEQGDSLVINAVDHGWRVGPEGCTTSNILFGVSASGEQER